MIKVKKNKKGQAVVEYVLVLTTIVIIVVWGLGFIKCSLHTMWIRMACDIIYPYPAGSLEPKPEHCEPIKECFDL